MPVSVLRYRLDGVAQWGVIRGGGVVPIPGDFATTGEFLGEGREEALARSQDEPSLGRGEVEGLCPITSNHQVICLGMNYRDHLREAGLDPAGPPYNMIFRKASSALAPADTDIVRPANVRLLDYEIELGLVIGRTIDGPVRVTDDTLLEFVAGLVITNDVSARDVQIPQMQFYKGKSYRTFAPTGPWLCLLEPDDLPKLSELEMCLAVNGELRQKGSTGDMIHGPAETLTELSGLQDLFAGDLVSTGTPAGVALGLPGGLARLVAQLLPEALRWRLFLRSQLRRPGYLQPGDVVESRIRSRDGTIDLGLQRNVVIG